MSLSEQEKQVEALRLAERCLTELYPSRAGMSGAHEAEYYAVNRVINKIHEALAQRTPKPAPDLDGDKWPDGLPNPIPRSMRDPAPDQSSGLFEDLDELMCAAYNGACSFRAAERRGMTAALAVARPVIEAEARKGYYSAEQLDAALRSHWDGPGDYDTAESFIECIHQRLSAPAAPKEPSKQEKIEEILRRYKVTLGVTEAPPLEMVAGEIAALDDKEPK